MNNGFTKYSRPTSDDAIAQLWMGKHYEGSDVQRRIETRKKPVFGKKKNA